MSTRWRISHLVLALCVLLLYPQLAEARQPHLIGDVVTSNSGGNLSVTLPTPANHNALSAAVNASTVMIGWVTLSAGGSNPQTMTTPAGWTKFIDCNWGGAANNAGYIETWGFYKVFATGDTTVSFNPSSSSPNNQAEVQLWNDAATGTPIETTSGSNCTGFSTTVSTMSTPSITPTSADATLMLFWATATGSLPTGPTGNILLGHSINPFNQSGANAPAFARYQSAPTTTSASAQYTLTLGTAKTGTAIAVVLDPANSGTADVPEVTPRDMMSCLPGSGPNIRLSGLVNQNSGGTTCNLTATCNWAAMNIQSNDLLVIYAPATGTTSVLSASGFTFLANGSGAAGGELYETWSSGTSATINCTVSTTVNLFAVAYTQSSNNGKVVVDKTGTGTVAAASTGLASTSLTPSGSNEAYVVNWHDSATNDGAYTVPSNLIQDWQPNTTGNVTTLGMANLFSGATGTFTGSIAADANPLNQESVLLGPAATATATATATPTPTPTATPSPAGSCTPSATAYLLNSAKKIMNGGASAVNGPGATMGVSAVDSTNSFIVDSFTGSASATTGVLNSLVTIVDNSGKVCSGTNSATSAASQLVVRICNSSNQVAPCVESGVSALYSMSLQLQDANGKIDDTF